MSSIAEQIASTAEGDIGKHRSEVNCAGDFNWCAKYVSEVLYRCDLDQYDTIVTYLLNQQLASGLWTEKTGSDMQRGDNIYFDWNHIVEERVLDHIGIVTKVEGNTITYVDGNGDGDQYVRQRTIAKDDPDVMRWTRYTADASFFTEKHLYDISAAQWDDTTLVERMASHAETGGFLIKYGQVNNIDSPYEAERLADNINAAKAHNLAIGFYFYWNVSPDGLSDDQIKTVFTTGLGYLSSKNITPSDVNMGLWLDFEDNGAASSDKSKNAHVVDLFIEVCTGVGYPVAGLYTYKAYLTSHFNINDVKDKPFWYSRPGESRATVDTELGEWRFTKAYFWQDGYPGGGYSPDKTYYFRDVDNDTQLMPIPTSGGGGGGTVSSVTVSVVDPKRIYFSPTPTVFFGEDEFLNLEQEITITTDAENAEIYYTLDGSSPYEYQRVVGNENWQYVLSSHAVRYTEPITIKTDTHLRVIAVPSGTTSAIDPLLAKGSGTYLFNFTPTAYSWDDEQYAYRLMSEDKKVKYFEENRQAFLRYHAEETTEEILYNTIIAITEQGTGTVQPDSGDVDEGGHAGDDT